MHKYKYLIKNIGLLTISNFGTKILSFVLIPLYTSILSTADYGTYDVYLTTVSLLIPILTLNIVEAVMRFTLDKDKNKVEVFTIGLVRALQSILILAVINGINAVLGIIPIFSKYALFFFLLFAGSLFYDLLSQFTRGIERIGDVAFAGAVNSLVMLIFNIVFLVYFRLGLVGYFIANCLAYYIPIIYLGIRIKVWKYIDLSKNNLILKLEMFGYSKPLVFNNIAWWINNVSDRYIVTWICGVAANGIYSLAYKIPSILNIFQSIFNQAWTLTAVKEFNEDSGKFYSRIYKIYNCGVVIVCSSLILFDRIIAQILFAKDFYIAWEYAPFLMISVVFGSLSGMLGGIFSAAKQSKILARTTIIGASVNTILNISLVYVLGPLGAAIATMISYVLVWGSRLINVKKIVNLEIKYLRDIISYVLLVVQSLLWFVDSVLISPYIFQLICVAIIMGMYLGDIKLVIYKVIKHVR